MRELKFRVWDKRYKRYAKPFAVLLDGRVDVITEPCNDLETLDSERAIIEFGTGIKDKNGKEIYEGDILREKWHDSEVRMGRDRIGEVEYFCDGYICWFRGSAYVGLGMFPTKNIEVIGNIHENQELLEHKG